MEKIQPDFTQDAIAETLLLIVALRHVKKFYNVSCMLRM